MKVSKINQVYLEEVLEEVVKQNAAILILTLENISERYDEANLRYKFPPAEPLFYILEVK